MCLLLEVIGLTKIVVVERERSAERGFCDTNAHPSHSAIYGLGLSNFGHLTNYALFWWSSFETTGFVYSDRHSVTNFTESNNIYEILHVVT